MLFTPDLHLSFMTLHVIVTVTQVGHVRSHALASLSIISHILLVLEVTDSVLCVQGYATMAIITMILSWVVQLGGVLCEVCFVLGKLKHTHKHTCTHTHDINWGTRDAWSSAPQLMSYVYVL